MRRLMLDMSQMKLADALGITFQQVHKYETGANRIGASRLHHIAQILRVPPTFFFEDDMPATGDSKYMIARPTPSWTWKARARKQKARAKTTSPASCRTVESIFGEPIKKGPALRG
jgi:transcriptional regulator with XRE-family HTH domain